MRTVSILAILLAVAANAVALVPSAAASFPYAAQPYPTYAAIAFGVVALLAAFAWRAPEAREVAAPVEPARPMPPPPTPTPEPAAGAEAVGLLGLLQGKGRLVDFLMGDITGYSDAQVGAAARVVHGGCRSVLQENFRIRPVREEAEGATVQVPAGYAADEYRLTGRIAGEPPFSGTLVHRGWRTEEARLPRIVRAPDDRLPTIAPAEVELK